MVKYDLCVQKINLSWIEKTLGFKVNAVKWAYYDNTKRFDTLNYLKPPEKGLPALLFPMQLWHDFLFKSLLVVTSVQSKERKHNCSWDRLEDIFFQTQQERTPFGSTKKISGHLIFVSYIPHKSQRWCLCNLQIYSVSYGQGSGGPRRAASPCQDYQLPHKLIPWRPNFFLGGVIHKNSLESQSLTERYGTQLACALKIQTSNYLHYFFIFRVIKHWLVMIQRADYTSRKQQFLWPHLFPKKISTPMQKAACL